MVPPHPVMAPAVSGFRQRPCDRRPSLPRLAGVDLIASADASADNILDYSVSPACQVYVIGEHIVRIPRCQVLAVANLSNHQPPAYPFPQVPSAPRHLAGGAHAYVGLRDGGTGAWDYTVSARAESDDCRAVSFRVYVEQGWAAVNGL